MRTFNLRLVLWLAGTFVVTVIVVHFLHDYQVRRNAGVYLDLATQKAAIVWDAKSDGAEKKRTETERAEIEQAAGDALQHYQRYLALDPTNVAVRADYGKLLAQVGALPRAYLQLERVLREDELNDEMRKLQVDVAIRLGRFTGAESHLDVLLKRVEGKESAPLLEQLGICQVRRGKDDEALKSFTAAIAISPERLSTYGLKTAVLKQLGNTPEAKDTIDAMVDANLDSADAHLMRARFLLETKDDSETGKQLDAATKACTRALELDPQNAEGLALAALCEQQSGRFVEAIELLRKSLHLKPDVAKRYLQLANVELQAKRAEPAAAIDAAIRAMREGLVAIPDSTPTFELRWRLADLLIGKENKAAAESAELTALRAGLLKEQPASPLLAYLDARQLFHDKEWIEAKRALEANRGKLSSWPDLQTKTDEMLVLCSTQTGDPELRLTTSRRLLDKNSLDAEARQGYAEALVGAGQLSEAIGEYGQILRLTTGRSADASDELSKRYFFLMFVEMTQRPKNQRDWAPLKSTLNEAANKTPHDPWVPLMRANIAVAEEDLDAAKLTLETAAKTMENDPSLLMALVDVAQRHNDNEEAARRLAEIEAKVGDTIEIRAARARGLIQQKGKDGLPQLADFTKDVEKLPAAEQEPEQLAQLQWQLAQLCWSQQDASLGSQYGRQAAALSPSNLQFRMRLLQNARVAQDVDAAKQLADEIQSIDKGGAVALYSQAVYDFTRFLVDKTNGTDGTAALREARDKLMEAQRLRPTLMQVPELLGDIAREQKDDDAALGHYRHAMELGNRDAETCAEVAFILYRRGRFDDADEVVKKFEEQQDATTLEMGRLASRISYFRNDLKRALDMAKIPVEHTKTPQRDDILFLGRLYALRGQFADAQLTIQKAIDLVPTDETAYLAMVQLLVAASKQAESDGKPDEAKKLLVDAEAKMAEAEQQVDPNKRALVVAHCLDFLGKPDLAVQKFEQAIKDTPQDAELLEAAARCYVNYPEFRGKAQPILEQFVAGQLTDDTHVLAWARRELALVLRSSRGYQNFLAALKLIEANLQANPDSVEDLELRARLLSSRLLPSLKKEAVKSLEHLVALPQPIGLETKFLLAQHYLSLGRWADARKLMLTTIVETDASRSKTLWPVLLSTYVAALLDHDEVSEAKSWVATLQREEPKALSTALLEARTLGPPKSKSLAPDAVAHAYSVNDALQILQKGVEDPDVHAIQAKNANETDDEYARRDAVAKKTVVVAVLDEFLQQIAKSGTPENADMLRATIDQYYAEIVASDPGRTLTQVPYLVRQGRRTEAVELTTKKENWETAQFWTLFSACEAVLADLEKHLTAPEVGDVGTPKSNGEETGKLTEEVRSQSAALEETLQNALVKYRGELDAAPPQEQEDKRTAVAFILSLLANHDFNTGHADPQRYQRAAGLYTEILMLQPENVEAIHRRAMILEARGESLGTSLDQIDRALASNGPLPMVLDAQAMILLASGKPQEALEAARQVITERPDGIDPATDVELAKSWGRYYFHLALVYDANENAAAAVKSLREAVKLGLGEADTFGPERAKWQGLVKKLGI